MVLKINKNDFETKSFEEVMEIAMEHDCICTADDLRNYVIDAVNNADHNLAIHLLETLRDCFAEYYDYDYTMGTLNEPNPIRDKEDLIDTAYIELID